MSLWWSLMCNLIGQIYENCKLFMESSGLNSIINCIQMFQFIPQKKDVINALFCSIIHLSKFKELRKELKMKVGLIQTVLSFIETDSKDTENCYLAIGILVWLMSDGQDSFNLSDFDSRITIEKILDTISTWPITMKLNGINYVTFESMFHLLEEKYELVCQYWTIWTLANFALRDGMSKIVHYLNANQYGQKM